MEQTKKSTKKAGGASADKIKAAYVEHLLTHGKQPASVFKFCLDLGVKEEEFYKHFGSFEGIESHVWKDFVDLTVARLKADEAYAGFSTRERVLAFYYTLLEELKSLRSFVLLQLKGVHKLELMPAFLKDFRKSFDAFFQELMADGKNKGEVAMRPFLDKSYPQLFWLHFGFLLLFWKEDNSAGFEKTDAAVEKSVNLAFDLIGKGAVDSAIDFAKFLYQTRH